MARRLSTLFMIEQERGKNSECVQFYRSQRYKQKAASFFSPSIMSKIEFILFRGLEGRKRNAYMRESVIIWLFKLIKDRSNFNLG